MRSFSVERDWTTGAGLRAVVTMGGMGFRCGYVGVPATHPLHGVGYSNESDWLTFPEDEQVGKRGIGFDCGHAGDGRDLEYIEDERLRAILSDDDGIVRSLDYCVDECESLAWQLRDRVRIKVGAPWVWLWIAVGVIAGTVIGWLA